MLTRDPKKRITAAEALGKYVTAAFYVLATHILMVFEVSIRFKLNKKKYWHHSLEPEHPWMKEGGEASDKPIDNVVLTRMKQFRAMNKMKKLALKVPQIFQQCINLNEIGV